MPSPKHAIESETPPPPLLRAQAFFAQVKDRVQPVDTWVRTLARERPLVALAGALGIGYLLGRLIRRI